MNCLNRKISKRMAFQTLYEPSSSALRNLLSNVNMTRIMTTIVGLGENTEKIGGDTAAVVVQVKKDAVNAHLASISVPEVTIGATVDYLDQNAIKSQEIIEAKAKNARMMIPITREASIGESAAACGPLAATEVMYN